jgi:hypothetical protein
MTFASGKLDPEWALANLERSIALAGAPKLSPWVVEGLVDLAASLPSVATRILAQCQHPATNGTTLAGATKPERSSSSPFVVVILPPSIVVGRSWTTTWGVATSSFASYLTPCEPAAIRRRPFCGRLERSRYSRMAGASCLAAMALWTRALPRAVAIRRPMVRNKSAEPQQTWWNHKGL